MIDQTVGLVAHLKLNAILKGEQGAFFELVKVELDNAHLLAQTLHDLRNADLSSAFTIAAPGTPAVLEVPAVGTVEQQSGAVAAAPDTIVGGDAPRTANAASPPTLDEARAAYRALSEGDKAAVARYWESNDTDLTDAAQIIESLAAIHGFHEIHTEAPVVASKPPKPTALPVAPDDTPTVDEGVTLDAVTLKAAGDRAKALRPKQRTWAGGCCQHIRLHPEHGGTPTERRMEILRGICTLAESVTDDSEGFASDPIVRACINVVTRRKHKTGHPSSLLPALTLGQARRFAELCDFVVTGEYALLWQSDSYCVIQPSQSAA